MTGAWNGRTEMRSVMLMSDRVRRLYCLECGDGAYTPLPATTFVEDHVRKHNIPEAKKDESFLVVTRPKGDDTIRLDHNLSSMFQKGFLEWGGAVKVAKKHRDKASKNPITALTSRL
jgi:hypothetical protein